GAGRAVFDGTRASAAWAEEMARARAGSPRQAPGAVRRQGRALRRQFDAIAAIDFFPGPARSHAESALAEAEAAAAEIVSPGEPRGRSGPIPRLDRAHYRGRVWATRRAPWVDRLACAWLIKRHIDPAASFVWLERPAGLPREAVGVDFDRAPFTPVRGPAHFR